MPTTTTLKHRIVNRNDHPYIDHLAHPEPNVIAAAIIRADNEFPDRAPHRHQVATVTTSEWIDAEDMEPCDYCRGKGREWTPSCEANKRIGPIT